MDKRKELTCQLAAGGHAEYQKIFLKWMSERYEIHWYLDDNADHVFSVWGCDDDWRALPDKLVGGALRITPGACVDEESILAAWETINIRNKVYKPDPGLAPALAVIVPAMMNRPDARYVYWSEVSADLDKLQQ